MISQDGNYVISFNGDVYNFQNLKNDLIKKKCTIFFKWRYGSFIKWINTRERTFFKKN